MRPLCENQFLSFYYRFLVCLVGHKLILKNIKLTYIKPLKQYDIDGLLTENVWSEAEKAANFVQQFPTSVLLQLMILK